MDIVATVSKYAMSTTNTNVARNINNESRIQPHLMGYAVIRLFIHFLKVEPLSETLSIDELRHTETLTPLERLYSFGKSDVAMHRYEYINA